MVYIDRKTKVAKLSVLVFYDRKHALEIEKEFRNLDSVPKLDMYLQKVAELKIRCRVQIVSVNTTNITEESNKAYYKDNSFGVVEIVNRLPINDRGLVIIIFIKRGETLWLQSCTMQ